VLVCADLLVYSAQQEAEPELNAIDSSDDHEMMEAACLLLVCLPIMCFLCFTYVYFFQHQDTNKLDHEAILARATHLLGGDKLLTLYGEGPNTKAVVYIIGNRPKELIKWVFSDITEGLLAFTPNNEILFTRCTVYHCSRMIVYYDEAYSFYHRGYIICFCTSHHFTLLLITSM
jgi:hypothetical protein